MTYRFSLTAFLWICLSGSLPAADFHLDSPRNQGTLRFEFQNDFVFDDDSQFTNGLSLQYHSVRYATWEETPAPAAFKWVGEHFPSLGDDDSIVRYSCGIGHDIVTPGDLMKDRPVEGDIPYAGTLALTLNWQSFNRRSARVFQMTAGVLGKEALAEPLQKFLHRDLNFGHEPKRWDTQRKTEPIVNMAYQYTFGLARSGQYHNGWAGQITLSPGVHLGNLFTSAELGLGVRFGWNILEGFNAFPAPPGLGVFQACHLPKPAAACPHGIEVVLGARATGLLYSVLYDGSLSTDDERTVDRENFFLAGLLGLNYHYYDRISIRVSLVKTTDLIKDESIPDPPPDRIKTKPDISYGSLVVGFHF